MAIVYEWNPVPGNYDAPRICEIDEAYVTVEKKPQGFAMIDSALQRKIASMGGKAAHAKGVAHEWTSDEAKAAGRKGGSRPKKKPGDPDGAKKSLGLVEH